MERDPGTQAEPEPDEGNGDDRDPLDEAIEESFPASDPIASEGPQR